MIITHTTTIHGARRVYLGGASSLEAWIEPNTDNTTWTFHVREGFTAHHMTNTDKRQWAIHLLMQLADELNVPPDTLHSVPFEMIASLHSANPQENRRMPTPKKNLSLTGYMATTPGITRPKADYTSDDYSNQRRHR